MQECYSPNWTPHTVILGLIQPGLIFTCQQPFHICQNTDPSYEMHDSHLSGNTYSKANMNDVHLLQIHKINEQVVYIQGLKGWFT